jgi:hypothetical protein
MAQPAPRLLPLPDFELIAKNHRNPATELRKYANIPAFDASRGILDAIQNLTEEVRVMKNGLRARFTITLNLLDTQTNINVGYSDINNIARLANNTL